MDQQKLIDQCIDIIRKCHCGMALRLNKKTMTIYPGTRIAKEIDEYNYAESLNFGFFETIIPYLSVHDILVLFMTSKHLRVLIYNRHIPKEFDLDLLLIDIIDSKCKNCKFLLKDTMKRTHGAFDLMSHLFMTVCKKLDINKMNDYFKLGASENENYIHEYILYSSERKYEDKMNLFTYISDKFSITNLETMKIMCTDITPTDTRHAIIINNIVGSINIPLPSNEMLRFLLPYLCSYSLTKYLSYKTFLCKFEANNDNYLCLLKLINDNLHIYSPKVILILLELLITKQNIQSPDIYNLIKVTCTYGSVDIVIKLLNVISRDENYMGYIPMKEFLQTIIDTDDTRVKLNLLKYIKFDYNLSEFTELMSEIIIWVVNYDGEKNFVIAKLRHLKYLDAKLKILLSPEEYVNYNPEILEFLDDNEKLNEISIKFAMNIDLWSAIYCSHLSNDKLFKYIDIAIKNNKYDVATTLILNCSSITNDKLFEYIDNAINNNKYGVALALILHIHTNQYDNPNSTEKNTIYSHVQNMRPLHYVYDESSYMYSDSKVICKYKLKVLEINRIKLFETYYVQTLLRNNPHYYCEIFEKIILGLDQQVREYERDSTRYLDQFDREKFNSYERLFERANINIYTDERQCRKMVYEHKLKQLDEMIIFMIRHEKFKQMNLVYIISLLKSYTQNPIKSLQICNMIIRNYNFSKTFTI